MTEPTGEYTRRRVPMDEFVHLGGLHVLNEEALWPLGMQLVVHYVEGGETAALVLEECDPIAVIRTGLDKDEHSAKHRRWTHWLAERMEQLHP